MDPVLEQLHEEHQARLSRAPATREWLSEATASLVLLGVCALLWVSGPAPQPPDFLLVGGMLIVFALACQVTFELGATVTTPVQLIFVPLWFAVDPTLLPLVVACGQILGNALASLRKGGGRHWSRVLLAFPDAWYAVGPAAVLLVAGSTEPTLSQWPVYALALAAQFAVDLVVSMCRAWGISGVRPGIQVGANQWIVAVDLALAPVALVLGAATVAEPVIVVAVIPMLGLLSQFAKERDDRILNAMELSRAYRGTAQLMGDVLEADDAYTGGEHTHGVVALALAVGSELKLDPSAMRNLEFGALLHDVGKLRVPNEIINKPGRLTEAEWSIVRRHPGDGQEMLDRVGGALSEAGAIVRAHHERWDGNGYPDGLKGEEIPLESRIVTVCDSFSAMTTDRSYRRGMTRAQASEELARCAGEQFDPVVVAALEVVLARLPDAALGLVAAPTDTPAVARTASGPRSGVSPEAARAA